MTALLAGSMLSACGGGSNNSSQTTTVVPNQSPTVSILGETVFDEKTAATLMATASDSDGTISSYSWEQISGTTVDLSGETTTTLTFTAPVAKTEETLNFQLTVTDDDGAETQSSVDVTIAPVNEITFQYDGLVTNGEGFSADLNIQFGDETFTQATNADGAFSINIEADEDLADALLIMTATSTADSEIVFTNTPTALGTLMTNSTNGVLSSAEDKTLNITSLSTAIYGLAMRDAGDEATDDELRDSLELIDGAGAIPLATALTVISQNNSNQSATTAKVRVKSEQDIINEKIIDRLNKVTNDGEDDVTLSDLIAKSASNTAVKTFSRENFATGSLNLFLPDEYASTLEFILDEIGTIEYVAGLIQFGGTIFNDTRAAMLADLDITAPVSATVGANFPVSLIQATENIAFGARFDLNDDGTGVFSMTEAATDILWQEESDGTINFTGIDGGPIPVGENLTDRFINNAFVQVRQVTILTDLSLKPILSLPNGTLYTFSQRQIFTFPDDPDPGNPEFDDFDLGLITSDTTFIMPDDLLDIDLDAIFDGSSEFPLLTSTIKDAFRSVQLSTGDDLSYTADVYTLSRNGTDLSGTVDALIGSEFLSNGQWSLSDPRTLQISFDTSLPDVASPVTFDYSLYDNNRTTVTIRDANDNQSRVNSFFGPRDLASAPTTEAEAEGVYNLDFGPGATSVNFNWIEIRGNNEADVVTVQDFDQDGILEQSEVFSSPGTWELTPEGNIFITQFRSTTTFATDCDPGTEATCLPIRTRDIEISNRVGDEIHSLNRLKIFFDLNGDSSNVEQVADIVDIRPYNFTTTPPVDISALPPD